MTTDLADWPIAAAMLPFSSRLPDGSPLQTASAEQWHPLFQEIAEAGFDHVDLSDNCFRPGDMPDDQLDALASVIKLARLKPSSISVVRSSVIDERHGDDHLAYSHRSLEAATRLGIGTVSIGLHRPLTEAQQRQLWFWTVAGHRDDPDDRAQWQKAVTRIRELGQHAAELGIVLSLEMYEDTYLGSADSAVAMVEEIGLASVGLNPDIGNLIRLHRPVEPWLDALRKVLPWSNFWHAKNYMRDEDAERDHYVAFPAPMESGLIDYRQAMKLAVEAGFRGVICLEHYGGDGLSVCAANQRYLRERVLPACRHVTPHASRVRQPHRG
ncbi:sugar phosphate isomerase/epimerase [Salinicola corii]|uniref:Sugar phosphate isomerase/epimerase n=1 Tax=Salinicola corii TaxID=2606937 RepID=A0A640W9R4_9GAMM|nr:sugar phosphate isomerase/epimerase family protein [Salinicola corii]KAA0016818.1 sugar phosphate isomerase/epimerase [Salinicola corii]